MEMLEKIPYVLIAAVVMLVATFICKYLYTKWNEIKTNIKNEKIRNVIDEVVDIVYRAVVQTNQIYVDSLKNSGTFDEEAAKTAFSKTKNTIMNLLSNSMISIITEVYGDFNTYIDTLIESIVNEEKS